MNFMFNTDKTKLLAKSLIFALVAFHIFCIGYFAINVGWWDDYVVTFYEMEKYLNADSIKEKLGVLTWFYGDHRSMLSRVFFITQITLNNNTVDYRLLMIIGSVFSFLIVFVFYRIWKRERWDFILFIPVVMLLLNLQFYEAQFFANGVFGYIAIVFFSIYLIWITAYKQNIWLMMLLGIVALLTFGNALFTLVGVLVMLVFQKKTRLAIVWLIYCLVTVLIYFNGIEKSPHAITEINSPKIVQGIEAFILHVGSPFNFDFTRNAPLSYFVGSLQIIFLAYFFVNMSIKLIKKEVLTNIDIFLIGLLVFSMLSALAIGINRGQMHVDLVLLSRYRLAPLMLLVISYLILLRYQNKWLTMGLFTVFIIGFYLPTQIIFFTKTKNFYVQKMAEGWIIENIRDTKEKSFNSPFDYSQPKNVYYKPDNSIINQIRKIDLDKCKSVEQFSKLEIIPKPFGSTIVFQSSRDLSQFSKKNGLLLFFKNDDDKKDFFITVDKVSYAPQVYFKELVTHKENLNVYIINDYYSKGQYKIYLVEMYNNKLTAFSTKQKIIL